MATTRTRRVTTWIDLTDDQLVARFQHDRAEGAVGELLRRHEGLIGSVARRFFVSGGDRDDVRQQAMIGFWKAVRDFDPVGGSGFPGFARGCMERHVITAVKAANRKKHAPLTASDRIAHHDTEARDDDRPPVGHVAQPGHEEASVGRMHIDCGAAVPLKLSELEDLIASLGTDAVHDLVQARFVGRPSRVRKTVGAPASLSETEAQVLVGLISGAKYRDIADRLGTSEKSVDNTIQRLRTKLRHLLDEE